MEPATARRAIQAALSADWENAIDANITILKNNPSDIDALMRLSHAYIAVGKYKDAKKFAKKVVNLDPSNILAQKCLTRCASLETNPTISINFSKVSLDNFLEEPGRTKTVALKNVGTQKTIAAIIPGESVVLTTTKRQASIQTGKGDHVGHLPDDIASWVIFHKKQGESVHCYIKSASQGVVVLIKLRPST